MNLDEVIRKVERELADSTNAMRAHRFGTDREMLLIDALYKLETIKHLREPKSADQES